MRFPCPRCAGGLGGLGITFGFWWGRKFHQHPDGGWLAFGF